MSLRSKLHFKPRLPRNYGEQTYANPYWIIRYPHQARFAHTLRVFRKYAPARVLDYGAGDGHVLFDTLLPTGIASQTVAYEPVNRYASQIAEDPAAAELELVRERSQLAGREFDLILCLSVLEHMPLPERYAFYKLCEATLSESGVCLIDVPVEIGPTLLAKHLGRTKLKGRTSESSRSDLIRRVLGGTVYDPSRFDPTDERTWIHHHNGFDYRLFRRELEHRFRVVDVTPTPIAFVPPWFGNQEVFFLITRKPR